MGTDSVEVNAAGGALIRGRGGAVVRWGGQRARRCGGVVGWRRRPGNQETR
jgi:hypothetical protein